MNPKTSFRFKVASLVGRLIIRPFEFFIRLFQGEKAFFPTQNSAWVQELEQHTQAILLELEALLESREGIPAFSEISSPQARITKGKEWKTFMFHAYGHKFEQNCSRCPTTSRLLSTIPRMKTAMFSILEPHAHITPHRGPFKGVLRYHLGLIIPEGKKCKIRIGDELAYWETGKSLLFDDTIDHEAWNDSDEVRVILFVDVMRELPPPLSWMNHLLIYFMQRSPFIQEMVQFHDNTKDDLLVS